MLTFCYHICIYQKNNNCIPDFQSHQKNVIKLVKVFLKNEKWTKINVQK